jgi:hypothetical protein
VEQHAPIGVDGGLRPGYPQPELEGRRIFQAAQHYLELESFGKRHELQIGSPSATPEPQPAAFDVGGASVEAEAAQLDREAAI